MLDDEIDGDLVFAAPGYDDVGMHPCGRDVVVKGRLNIFRILVNNSSKITASIGDVTLQPAGKPFVRVDVDKNLHIEHVSDFLRQELDSRQKISISSFYSPRHGRQKFPRK